MADNDNGADLQAEELQTPYKSNFRQGIEHLLVLAETAERQHEEYYQKSLRVTVYGVVVVSALGMALTLLYYLLPASVGMMVSLGVCLVTSAVAVLSLLYKQYWSLRWKMKSERAAMYATADMLRDLLPTVQKRSRDTELLVEMRIRLSRLSIGPGDRYFERISTLIPKQGL